MPEEKTPATPETPAAGEPTPDRNYDGMRIAKTIEQGKEEAAAAKAPEAPTAESLGVDKASFDKFFKDGEFDWSSYGKEQAFKAKQAATKEDPEADKKEEPRKSDAPKHSQTKEAQDAVDKAGLDWDSLGNKITEAGDIEPGDYEALKAIGIPEHVVKTYVTSVKNEAQSLVDDVIDRAGGQAVFDKVFDALADKPLDLRERIDGLLADPATRDDGIEMMFRHSGVERPQAKSAEPEPKPATPTSGAVNRTGTGGGETKGFASFEEQVAAQRDPRYKKDLTYRNEVMKRIAASDYTLNPRTHTGGL